MNTLEILASNPIVNATLLAWFVAQFLKVILVLITQKRVDFSRFVGAGGMPSSHASTVCALAVCVARTCSYNSPEFAICFVFAIVVMYDAAGVRRAAGQQAKILNKMLDNWETADAEFIEVELKELLGHTPIQVFFGALIGILIGLFTNI